MEGAATQYWPEGGEYLCIICFAIYIFNQNQFSLLYKTFFLVQILVIFVFFKLNYLAMISCIKAPKGWSIQGGAEYIFIGIVVWDSCGPERPMLPRLR